MELRGRVGQVVREVQAEKVAVAMAHVAVATAVQRDLAALLVIRARPVATEEWGSERPNKFMPSYFIKNIFQNTLTGCHNRVCWVMSGTLTRYQGYTGYFFLQEVGLRVPGSKNSAWLQLRIRF